MVDSFGVDVTAATKRDACIAEEAWMSLQDWQCFMGDEALTIEIDRRE